MGLLMLTVCMEGFVCAHCKCRATCSRSNGMPVCNKDRAVCNRSSKAGLPEAKPAPSASMLALPCDSGVRIAGTVTVGLLQERCNLDRKLNTTKMGDYTNN